MSKAKLTLSQEDAVKLPVAAEVSNVKIDKLQKVGSKIKAEVDFKDPASLFDLGREVAVTTPESVKEFNAMKEAEKKAAEAEKKGGK